VLLSEAFSNLTQCAVHVLLVVSDGKKCSFSFREDTDCWLLLLNEMWSGRVLAEEQSDMRIRGLALQNVLIVDAFLRRFGTAVIN